MEPIACSIGSPMLPLEHVVACFGACCREKLRSTRAPVHWEMDCLLISVQGTRVRSSGPSPHDFQAVFGYLENRAYEAIATSEKPQRARRHLRNQSAKTREHQRTIQAFCKLPKASARPLAALPTAFLEPSFVDLETDFLPVKAAPNVREFRTTEHLAGTDRPELSAWPSRVRGPGGVHWQNPWNSEMESHLRGHYPEDA